MSIDDWLLRDLAQFILVTISNINDHQGHKKARDTYSILSLSQRLFLLYKMDISVYFPLSEDVRQSISIPSLNFQSYRPIQAPLPCGPYFQTIDLFYHFIIVQLVFDLFNYLGIIAAVEQKNGALFEDGKGGVYGQD